MNRLQSSPTRTLVLLCLGYFLSYVGTGIAVKYFTSLSSDPIPQMTFLIQNTSGSVALVLIVVGALGWIRRSRSAFFSKQSWPLAVSGLCTAIVIPATTLLYLLPVSVMVAMVLMRGSVIVVSRLVDQIQRAQGILKKPVSWEENLAVIFALLGVGTNFPAMEKRHFDFIHNPAAMSILSAYLLAYAFRIYIMNVYKNSAAKLTVDNRSFFVIEQIWATIGMIALIMIALLSGQFDTTAIQIALQHPHFTALSSGVFYAGVAFFSVFIFMFRGRSATFAGVLNRITSLLAGTTATLLLAVFLGTPYPSKIEWMALLWIGAATVLLGRAELKYTHSKIR